MKIGIRAKLFLISLAVISITVVVSYLYARTAIESGLTDEVRGDLEARARLVALQASSFSAPAEDTAAWDALADELGESGRARVTLVTNSGKVIGDSEVELGALSSLENHAERPEIVEARESGRGESTRFSATIDQRLLYVAVPFQRGGRPFGVSRVSVPLTQVDAAISRLQGTLSLAFFVALVVAVLMSTVAAQLASRTARSLTESARRMADGDLRTRTAQGGADEFGELGRALDRLARNLSSTLDELRTQRDRLSGILRGMQEGVLLVGDDGRVALVNPALREMLLLGSDAVGKTPLEVVRHAELKNLVDRALLSHHNVTAEIEVGGIKPRRLLVRAAPLPGKQGGVFAVFVDVTEIRRLETLRKDFVANVSHELRTPVTAIRSAAETLELAMEHDSKAAARFVDMINRNASRLHELVEDLLDLSRIESREYKLNPEPLALVELLSSVSALFRDRADKQNLRLEVELDRGLDTVVGDRRALEHVLTNLVDNAVKYAGPRATVRLIATDHADHVTLAVSDDGPGIEPRHLPRLFERFYRVDAGRSRELGGTGLGLSIVKHLVEAMGAEVRVHSVLGGGTTFSFDLPKEPPSQPKIDAELEPDGEAEPVAESVPATAED